MARNMEQDSSSSEMADGSFADHVDRIEAEWNRERPDIDVSSVGIITRVWRIGRHLEMLRNEVLVDWETDPGTIDILGMLRRVGAPYRRTAGELTKSALITSGGVSQRLEKMERAGLIKRHVDVEDRRRVAVELTPAGVELIDSVLSASMERDTITLDSALSTEEQTLLRTLLKKLLLNLEPHAADDE